MTFFLLLILAIGLMIMSYAIKKSLFMGIAIIIWLFSGIAAREISEATNDIYWLLMIFSFMMSVTTMIISATMMWPRKEGTVETSDDEDETDDDDDNARIAKDTKRRAETRTRMAKRVQEIRERRLLE